LAFSFQFSGEVQAEAVDTEVVAVLVAVVLAGAAQADDGD
jgi:hypothetical protein